MFFIKRSYYAGCPNKRVHVKNSSTQPIFTVLYLTHFSPTIENCKKNTNNFFIQLIMQRLKEHCCESYMLLCKWGGCSNYECFVPLTNSLLLTLHPCSSRRVSIHKTFQFNFRKTSLWALLFLYMS